MRVVTATSDNYADISRLQRLGTIKLVNNYMMNNGIINFLFGNGLGSASKFMLNNTIILQNFITTDNQYLSFFYEFGFIGLSSYVILLILVLSKLTQGSRDKSIYILSSYIFVCISISMFFYESFGKWIDILFMLMFSMSTMSIMKLDKRDFK